MAVNIASSIAVAAQLEIDGRFWVTETHTDIFGLKYNINYLAAAGFDYQSALVDHAQDLSDNLAASEIANNFQLTETLGKNAAPVTHYSTAAANVAALSAAWHTLLNQQAIFIGEYLNTLSNATLQAVFGWTPTQAAQVRTDYLTPYATLAQSIRAAQGGLF